MHIPKLHKHLVHTHLSHRSIHRPGANQSATLRHMFPTAPFIPDFSMDFWHLLVTLLMGVSILLYRDFIYNKSLGLSALNHQGMGCNLWWCCSWISFVFLRVDLLRRVDNWVDTHTHTLLSCFMLCIKKPWIKGKEYALLTLNMHEVSEGKCSTASGMSKSLTTYFSLFFFPSKTVNN